MKSHLRDRISRFFDGLRGAPGTQQQPREPNPIKALPPYFDPAFPLETLPFDIKYALLETIASIDYDAFVSLILASRAYHEVFTMHKRGLSRVALWHDALKYKEESFFVAAVYDHLLDASRHISRDESKRIEDAYNDAIDPRGFDTEPWQRRWWWAWNENSPSFEEPDAHAHIYGPEMREEHQSCSLFALLVHEFPLYATEWITSFNPHWNDWQPPADRFEAMNDWTSNLDTRIETGSAHWMIPRLLYYANHTDSPAPEVELKRICVQGRELFLKKADYLSMVRFWNEDEFLWGHPERQRVDPWMVLWDDWRLERWGYALAKIV
ncbi:hypothetical protein TWF103_000459 [Orbilia oligospora]|nr:hypothetical protein TWF103_000459 [Orbilia oligospora]